MDSNPPTLHTLSAPTDSSNDPSQFHFVSRATYANHTDCYEPCSFDFIIAPSTTFECWFASVHDTGGDFDSMKHGTIYIYKYQIIIQRWLEATMPRRCSTRLYFNPPERKKRRRAPLVARRTHSSERTERGERQRDRERKRKRTRKRERSTVTKILESAVRNNQELAKNNP